MVLSGSGVNIVGANTVSHRDGIVEMRFLIEVSDTALIESILRDLRGVEGIIDTRRMLPGESIRKHKEMKG